MWRSPFWSGIPMLVGEPDPDPWPDTTALLPLLAGAGARVEGLRLMSGRLVLKVELGNALLQILVPSGRMFAPGDGIMAKLGLSLPPEASVARVEELWRVSGRLPPPRRRRGPGEEHQELLNVLDTLAAVKSVRRVATDVLRADGTEKWDPGDGPRSKAKRRIRKATDLMKGGYKAFLEPGAGRRRRVRKPDSPGA